MKLYSTIYSSIALATAISLSGCTNGNEPIGLESSAVTFEVNDAGFASTTRASEAGYATEFTAGDACGLYIVRNGNVVCSNVKLSATENGDSLIWQAATPIGGGLPGERYYLYYPYQSDMDGKVDATAAAADGFFAPLISGWQPATDQSLYSGYTASDLLTAQGTASKSSDGTLLLSFTMTHRMALAVIEMPKTVYKFTNTDQTISDYIIAPSVDFATSEAKPCSLTPGTYRYIVNPASKTVSKITGVYDNGSKAFTVTTAAHSTGSYKTYKVNNASTAEIEHNLQAGDYLLTDGSFISKDLTLNEDQKAKVAAIVFWISPGSNSDGVQIHPSLADDKIMVMEHPYCIHGLAISTKVITTTEYSAEQRWQFLLDAVSSFQSSNQFVHPFKEKFRTIRCTSATDELINYILGYQNTQVLLAYNQTRTDTRYFVKPAAAIAEYEKNNKAPAGSTGWYIPSVGELQILSSSHSIVNTSISTVGGNKVNDNNYTDTPWSSTEKNNVDVWIYDFREGRVRQKSKDWNVPTWAVCAF